MSNEILNHENLGSFDDIILIFDNINSSNGCTKKDLEQYSSHKNQSEFIYTDGILALLDFLEFTKIMENKILSSEKGKQALKTTQNKDLISKNIVLAIIEKISTSEEILNLISPGSFLFNPTIKSYNVKNSHLKLRFSGLRNLLINLGYFHYDDISSSILVINPEYLESSKNYLIQINKKQSFMDFKRKQELLELLGKIAEEFVLVLEKNRLPIKSNQIRRISDIDVYAGYDIISFDNDSSKEYDKYIEVKSYSDAMGFFWSKNEIKVSKQKGEKYYIYLVDRNKVNEKKYVPLMIRNPYKNIYCNAIEWEKKCTDWYFAKI